MAFLFFGHASMWHVALSLSRAPVRGVGSVCRVVGYALGMRDNGRWRGVAVKWSLLAAALGVLAMAFVGARWPLVWVWMDAKAVDTGLGLEWRVHLSSGAIRIIRQQHLPNMGLVFERGVTFFDPLPIADALALWRWLPRGDVGRVDLPPAGYSGWFSLPLWIPFLLTIAPFLWMWRTDRKAARLARVGACVSCCYNRAGLAAGAACPECGELPRGANAGGGAS